MWALWNVKEPLTKNGHWLYEGEEEEIIAKQAAMNIHEQLQKGTPNSQQIKTFLAALHELNMPTAHVDYALHYDYASNTNTIKEIIAQAKEKNENFVCDIRRYKESTKQLIIQLEGKPFLEPRISTDSSGKVIITIGYGYDFTEEDPVMFNKYLKRDIEGNIVVVGTMSLEEAEKQLRRLPIRKEYLRH